MGTRLPYWAAAGAAMRKAGYPQVFIDTFVTEATAGNYDDLLATVMRYVVVE